MISRLSLDPQRWADRVSRWSALGGWRGWLAETSTLRTYLPHAKVEPGAEFGFHLDLAAELPGDRVMLYGWAHDHAGPIQGLDLLGSGSRISLLEGAWTSPRPDLDGLFPGQPSGQHRGFLASAAAPDKPLSSGRARLEVGFPSAGVRRFQVRSVERDPFTLRERLLAVLPLPEAWDEQLLRTQVHPNLQAIQEGCAAHHGVTEEVAFGRPPEAPKSTLVVPLYRRLDFVEHQLAHFSHDPEFADIDLVYVLDSPEQAPELIRQATQLEKLYQLPFRLLVLPRNLGYGPANNLGAQHARGEHLVFLNSDVLPARPGWVSALRDFHAARDDLGAVGPRLLFEDGAVQHAGLYFSQDLFPERAWNGSVWYNLGYLKGMPGTGPAARRSRAVPAVTGACLSVLRERFEQVGGFDNAYPVGDCEDTDLCLALSEAGWDSWYLADVELYHLEGQSYPSESRRRLGHYNHWLQTQRRGEQIAALMRRHAATATRAAPRVTLL